LNKEGRIKDEQQLRTLAITCLLLASKYDELDDRIPFINDMSKLLRKVTQLHHSEVVKTETDLLFAFNWDLMILTPLHFVYSITA
jgi:hypothetical protein